MSTSIELPSDIFGFNGDLTDRLRDHLIHEDVIEPEEIIVSATWTLDDDRLALLDYDTERFPGPVPAATEDDSRVA